MIKDLKETHEIILNAERIRMRDLIQAGNMENETLFYYQQIINELHRRKIEELPPTHKRSITP